MSLLYYPHGSYYVSQRVVLCWFCDFSTVTVMNSGGKRTDWTDFSDWLVCLVCLVYPRFFLEQNNRIFQTLSEVAGSSDPTVTQESVRAMGLDPHGDRLFLLHLLEIYGYDTLLVSEQLCCSWESPLLVLEGGLTCLEPTESAALHGVFRTVWASRNVSGAFVSFCFLSPPASFVCCSFAPS